jgi:hypothetical protein
MLGLDVISFLHKMSLLFSYLFFLKIKKKKKKKGEDAEFLFSFDSFLDITCIFA